jgi:beta-lactamase regulating signal transducer with metallopeptidase domain
MGPIENAVLAFVVNAAWQVGVVAIVAALITAMMRRAGARYHHVVWCGALAFAVAIPVGSAVWTLLAMADAGSPTLVELPSIETPSGVAESAGLWNALGAFRAAPNSIAISPSVAQVVVCAYALFLLSRLVRLLRAFRNTILLRRSGLEAVLGEAGDSVLGRCRSALGVGKVAIRTSEHVKVPVTLGVRNPAIILPAHVASDASVDELASVLAHELAHVRRRDYAVNFAAEIAYALVAFHPGAWLVRGQLSRSRELACDELATESLVAPPVYAKALLRIAGSLAARSDHGYCVGICDADILEERIMRLLQARPRASARAGRMMAAVALCALVAVGMTASAFAINCAQADPIGDAFITGTWKLRITQDGPDAAKRDPKADEMMGPELTLVDDNGRLSGTVEFPAVVKTPEGPRVQGQPQMKVVDAKFDGALFTFKVNNGEELLIGKLKRMGDSLEGRWISSESMVSGTLTMKRIR